METKHFNEAAHSYLVGAAGYQHQRIERMHGKPAADGYMGDDDAVFIWEEGLAYTIPREPELEAIVLMVREIAQAIEVQIAQMEAARHDGPLH